MTRRTLGYALCAAAMGLAAPIQAGTVYVPLAGQVEVQGTVYQTKVWATNADPSEQRRIEYFFIASLADGTVRETPPTLVRIAPGATYTFEVPAGRGTLEIFGAPQITISSRLVETSSDGPAREIELPMITSDTAAEAGETQHLQGWASSVGEKVTHFGLVNLGDLAMACEVEVSRGDGSQIGIGTVQIPARSHMQYDDVLGLLGESDIADARASISCDQKFFSYSATHYVSTGDVTFTGPSAKASSTLARPGSGGGGGGGGNGEFVYLSDLTWSGANVQNGPHRDRSGWNPHASGGPRGGYKSIEVNGVTYPKGIAWFPNNFKNSWVEWPLNGQYSRFTAIVRFDDEKHNEYEWAVVNRSTGEFIRLERPPEGFRGPERNNQFRVGAGGTIQILGDGQLLYTSPEFYAYGAPVAVDLDVTGVTTLKIQLQPGHSEQRNAPYRNGLTSTPARVNACTWFDLIDLADAKLYLD